MEPLFGSTPPTLLPPHLRWTVPDAKEHTGKSLYLAGKPITLRTHRVGRRTWPCLYQWPHLGRECPHCDRSQRSTTWVPVLTCAPPYKRLVLMGGETTWNSVRTLERGTLVECHFAKMLKPTLVFSKSPLPVSLTLARLVGEEMSADNGDISRWLLHYWQWPDLSKWFNQAYRESLKVRSTRERCEVTGFSLHNAG